VIAISQSGETADTIAQPGSKDLRMPYSCNNECCGNNSFREVENIVFTRAGPRSELRRQKRLPHSSLPCIYFPSIFHEREKKWTLTGQSASCLNETASGMIQKILNNKEFIKKQAIRFSKPGLFLLEDPLTSHRPGRCVEAQGNILYPCRRICGR